MAEECKRWFDGAWHYDPSGRCFRHLRAGWYDGCSELPDGCYDIVIPREAAHQLAALMQEQGHTSIKAESREEDLKIVHRLLDIMEKR